MKGTIFTSITVRPPVTHIAIKVTIITKPNNTLKNKLSMDNFQGLWHLVKLLQIAPTQKAIASKTRETAKHFKKIIKIYIGICVTSQTVKNEYFKSLFLRFPTTEDL